MINGKVARILSEYQLVLNVGSKHGVERDMTFVVYEEGDEIVDPDSGEPLGRLELVKAEVHVAHVQPDMCLVQSPRKPEQDEHTVLSARLAEVPASPSKRLERMHYQLPVSKQDVSGAPSLRPIRVGDPARSLA